jgi:predicted ATPase
MSLLAEGGASYLQSVQLLPERVANFDDYPFCLPVIRNLKMSFRKPVTFLVGENGSGKSTIIEGIAGLLGLPLAGGSTVDTGKHYGPNDDHSLARALRPSFRRRPGDAFFFRGEYASHFAQLLDERNADPDFLRSGNPYALYGGGSLLRKSHGEGFLSVMRNRIRTGIYLLDEPESALSPVRQLSLMKMIAERASEGSQLVIATHSPILMTVPNAQILLIERDSISSVDLRDTEHYKITEALLRDPSAFWEGKTR